MKITAVWFPAPCSLLDIYQHFGETYCFHRQGVMYSCILKTEETYVRPTNEL
jgi:hypothetical protein